MPQIHHKSGSFVTGDDWKLQQRCGAVMEIYFFCKGIGLSFCGELFYLSPAQSSQTSYCHCMKCFKAGRSPALPAGWLPLAEESVSDNLESLSSSTSSGWPLSKQCNYLRMPLIQTPLDSHGSDLHQNVPLLGPILLW